MKIFALLSLALALVISAFSSAALATPVRASFSGTVSGGLAFSGDLLNEFPLGTAASFDVMFDDRDLAPYASGGIFDLTPVSGIVRLGALAWSLDGGHIVSYSYTSAPGFPITSYGLQLTGTGPLIADGDSLFGLFLGLTPTLDFVTTNPYMVGFGSPFPGGVSYGYATLAGASSIGRVSVPEPGTLFLVSAAFALVWVRRKRLSSASA